MPPERVNATQGRRRPLNTFPRKEFPSFPTTEGCLMKNCRDARKVLQVGAVPRMTSRRITSMERKWRRVSATGKDGRVAVSTPIYSIYYYPHLQCTSHKYVTEFSTKLVCCRQGENNNNNKQQQYEQLRSEKHFLEGFVKSQLIIQPFYRMS